MAWSTPRCGQIMHVDLPRVVSSFDISIDYPRSGEQYDVQKNVRLNICLLLKYIESCMPTLHCVVDMFLGMQNSTRLCSK